MESGCHPPSRRHSTNGNGHVMTNGHSPAKTSAMKNGSASLNGHGAKNGHAAVNGRAALNGYATKSGHAAKNGHAASNGHGDLNGHGTINGHGTRPGDVARELISALWERSVPLISERLHGLDIACEAAVIGRLSPIMRRGATDTAHKLAGSLGMFGYPRGTELAREIEQLLECNGVVDAGLLRELVVELRESLPL
jgi:HPt (histidine-containing phosphotransfer) domain-containing protein